MCTKSAHKGKISYIMSLFMIFANVANRLEKLQWDFFGGGGGVGGKMGNGNPTKHKCHMEWDCGKGIRAGSGVLSQIDQI